ncbi:MAG: 5'-3' exonuclease H3TH domain-containing protein [Kiritimatiellia bacterium]|nr:5'-3' exonuclease H3TH domain-containing protein [Kiritimatiellia bacterium]
MTSRIILVDALGMIYRAFYAVTGLATSAGRPTNAVFGFIRMLGQINRVWSPTHELVVFDGGIPAERRRLLGSYKAQRPPMPEQLRVQLSDIREYLDAALIKSVRIEGKEADDILASAAVSAEISGLETMVATSDKDLMQIVGGHIAMIAPGKVGDKIGPDEIYQKTGVRPKQIVEWLALTGDSADNIPGVPGIGAKTAAKLLNEWGSLQEIFNHLEQLKPEKMRALLESCRPDVLRNIQIITLDKNIPLPCPVEDMKINPPDTARLRAFFERMEFHSLAAGI